MGYRTEPVAIKRPKAAEGRLAQTHRLFQHRVEHRRKIARGGIDDLQHLGGGSLLLTRLFQFAGESAYLIL